MAAKICIGFESTAHTSGVGIATPKGKIFANVKHSLQKEDAGMIPRELAEHHTKYYPEVLRSALEKSKLGWDEIDCVAYSAGPGIGTALTVACTAAKMCAALHSKPLVAVNHAVAHIEIAKKLCKSADPLILYVSGGNTQVIGYESGKYRVYGETLDIGIGNLLDSFGRAIGMGFPAGPRLDEMYFGGHKYIELPYLVKGMDMAFSGLQTAAEKKIGKEKNDDIAYSLMHNAFASIAEVCERALAHTGKKELLVTGGVACSRALGKMLTQMCSARKVKLKICPREYATDNGAMIAYTGALMFEARRAVPIEKAKTSQGFRVDYEQIDWV